MMKTYLACWERRLSPPTRTTFAAATPQIQTRRIAPEKPPKLVNPPSNPAQKPQAKSVLQAVKACDPLPMPAQYRSFYEQWKTKTIHFDPQIAAR